MKDTPEKEEIKKVTTFQDLKKLIRKMGKKERKEREKQKWEEIREALMKRNLWKNEDLGKNIGNILEKEKRNIVIDRIMEEEEVIFEKREVLEKVRDFFKNWNPRKEEPKEVTNKWLREAMKKREEYFKEVEEILRSTDIEEVEQNLRTCKGNSAAGKSGIGYKILQELPRKAIEEIVILYNEILEGGKWPKKLL